MLQNSSLVLARDEWHEGVIGIVAARLTEQYHKPVIVISVRDDVGKGSARSVEGIDLYRILQRCKDPLEGFGGHAMAAGLRIKKDNLERFRQLFEQSVKHEMANRKSSPEIRIDAQLDLHHISNRLIDDIQRLRPFGQANAEPVLMVEHVRAVRSRIVGGRHLKMWLTQPGEGAGRTFEAIQFNVDPDRPAPVDIEAMAFRLQWNFWNGRKTAQLVVEDMRY
jgi:single-stranded-DNA-specific exonuclease